MPEAAVALIIAPPAMVGIEVEYSDEMYRLQINGLQAIQDRYCNCKSEQLLLGNEYDNLGRMDMYETFDEDTDLVINARKSARLPRLDSVHIANGAARNMYVLAGCIA
jgi:hypothetical protein